jgi:phage tail tape-measure protein
VKLLFIPFSVIGGLLSGFLAKKLFEQAWGVVDDEEPPKPAHRQVPLAKVVAAAALEGAIFKGTRAAIDHKSREAFANATGTWPGEERPDEE